MTIVHYCTAFTSLTVNLRSHRVAITLPKLCHDRFIGCYPDRKSVLHIKNLNKQCSVDEKETQSYVLSFQLIKS